MKKILAIFTVFSLLLSLLVPVTALAADDLAEEIFVVSAPEDEYVDYSNMFYFSNIHDNLYLIQLIYLLYYKVKNLL